MESVLFARFGVGTNLLFQIALKGIAVEASPEWRHGKDSPPLLISATDMPAKQKWIVHEESSLEGVAKFKLMIRSFAIISHGHDNALNNKAIFKGILGRLAERRENHLEEKLAGIIHGTI